MTESDKLDIHEAVAAMVQLGVDDTTIIILTAVAALKTQPGFDHDSFEAVIRERINKKDIRRSVYAALSLMLREPLKHPAE